MPKIWSSKVSDLDLFRIGLEGDPPGDDGGGAGVHEPRRPRPTLPGAGEALAEPIAPEPPTQLAGSQ